jgi:hypothetical protein
MLFAQALWREGDSGAVPLADPLFPIARRLEV